MNEVITGLYAVLERDATGLPAGCVCYVAVSFE
jgi:hypothetical protein